MCWCRPEIRTPQCNRPGCHPPAKPKHPTFYDTVTSSPQWKAWEAEQTRRQEWWSKNPETRGVGPLLYDMAEVMECGWISAEHFQAFLDFTIYNKTMRKL